MGGRKSNKEEMDSKGTFWDNGWVLRKHMWPLSLGKVREMVTFCELKVEIEGSGEKRRI